MLAPCPERPSAVVPASETPCLPLRTQLVGRRSLRSSAFVCYNRSRAAEVRLRFLRVSCRNIDDDSPAACRIDPPGMATGQSVVKRCPVGPARAPVGMTEARLQVASIAYSDSARAAIGGPVPGRRPYRSTGTQAFREAPSIGAGSCHERDDNRGFLAAPSPPRRFLAAYFFPPLQLDSRHRTLPPRRARGWPPTARAVPHAMGTPWRAAPRRSLRAGISGTAGGRDPSRPFSSTCVPRCLPEPRRRSRTGRTRPSPPT